MLLVSALWWVKLVLRLVLASCREGLLPAYSLVDLVGRVTSMDMFKGGCEQTQEGLEELFHIQGQEGWQ